MATVAASTPVVSETLSPKDVIRTCSFHPSASALSPSSAHCLPYFHKRTSCSLELFGYFSMLWRCHSCWHSGGRDYGFSVAADASDIVSLQPCSSASPCSSRCCLLQVCCCCNSSAFVLSAQPTLLKVNKTKIIFSWGLTLQHQGRKT